MPDVRLTRLRVWGFALDFAGFDDAQLAEVEREFAGAVDRTPDGAPADHRYVLAPQADDALDALAARAVRHRGGSKGDKRFLSGEPFDARVQQRDLHAVTGPGFAYVLGGCAAYATETETWFFGPALSPFALADTVENFLLNGARARAWLHCHGAAWLDGARATLVVGSSGAGKTTQLLSAVQAGASFLSNDRIFLRVHDGRLQARSFPLPVNVGCGTIRALDLALPHAGLPDDAKIRLTAADVAERFAPDYASWFDVAQICALTEADLFDNVFWAEDGCHPNWNAAQRRRFPDAARAELEPALLARARFGELLHV